MKFFLTCFFIALYIVRPFEFLPLLYGSPILIICGCLGLLSVGFSFINGKAKWCEIDTFMLGFFVAILLSHASHLYLGGVTDSFSTFLPIFLGYFLISHSVDSRKQVVVLSYLIVACACFISIEGYLEYTRGVSYFGIEPILQKSLVDGVRIQLIRIKWLGPFADPNDLALLFVIPIPFLLAQFRQKKVVSLVAGALLIGGIFCTNSRGGQLALFVAVFTYFTMRYRNKTGLIFGVIIAMCILAFGPSRVSEISANEGSAYGRLEAWHAGFQMFKQSPFFGVGMGMFTDFYERTAHNSFVLVMAELGFFGLFFFVGMFWLPLKRLKPYLWGELRQSISLEEIALFSSMAASLAAILTAMFFLSRSYILIPYLLIVMIARLSYSNNADGVVTLPNGETLKEIFLLSVFGIVFINIFIKLLL